MDKISDMDNLHLAFIKAVKGKQQKQEPWCYRKHLADNLQKMHEDITQNSLPIGNYHYFTIYDPKERQICAAVFGERVLHHAIMNICHDHFEKQQIFDSYACRKGKGTYAALDRASLFIKKYQWFVKLDVRKYFDSIDHNKLKQMLKRIYKDNDLLNVLFAIIDSYQTANGKGLPIGNLTSQYFANHYLSKADHYAKEKLQVAAYVRYMDDMVLFDNDKERLLETVKQFEQFIQKELKLELKPVCLNSNTNGLPFLGYLVYDNKIMLAKRSRQRFISKLKRYKYLLKTEQYSQSDYQKHILPLVAFTNYADSKGFRRSVIKKYG